MRSAGRSNCAAAPTSSARRHRSDFHQRRKRRGVQLSAYRALTGNNARHAVNATIQTAKAAAAEMKTTLDDLPARVAALIEERKKLERELSEAHKETCHGRRFQCERIGCCIRCAAPLAM